MIVNKKMFNLILFSPLLPYDYRANTILGKQLCEECFFEIRQIQD